MSVVSFDDSKVKLIKDTICKGATDAELELFLHVCKKSGLDPMLRQIYSIKRGNTRTIQTSIDGLRLIAERTGRYAPGQATAFTYDEKGRLVSATAFVKKMTTDGTWHEVSSTAFMAEYNAGQGLWGKMPTVMLSKCAESAALRRAFPAEMCGLYSDDEMSQAEEDKVIEAKPEPIKKLNDIQIGEIEALLTDELRPWFINLVTSRGYNSLKDVEATKFPSLLNAIRTERGDK